MPKPAEFDDFYVATRRRLVLQTFALTGDLGAARNAVRDAYVAARHHWRKVSRLEDPEDWVRPRAWATAQRRHVTRILHKEKGVTPEQTKVLETLQHLPDIQRKTLLLNHLASLSMSQIGREVGDTESRTSRHLQTATATFALRMDCDSTAIRALLESLEPVSATAHLPRAPLIRRSGQRRRRWHLVSGAALAVLLTIGAGAFVIHDNGHVGTLGVGKDTHPVTQRMLLTQGQVNQVSPSQQWRLMETSDNTRGTGINSVCQRSRFADPRGDGTFVRKFTTAGAPQRSLVQTVEISSSPGASAAAYKTTVGWFAGCTQARLQLLNSYRITGLGDEAQVLRLRIPDATQRTYVVGIVRTGSLTTSTVVETRNGRSSQLGRVVGALTDSVRDLCGADASGVCQMTPRTSPVLPPPSGETTGMLAVADLPPVGKINMPWVGTGPVSGRPNIAATTCDKADFFKAGAAKPQTRTFLIPQAKLPSRFGLTETTGSFRDSSTAKRLTDSIVKKMSECEDNDLAATVSHEFAVKKGFRGSQFALWRLDIEINDKQKVGFWMGVARVDNEVAQVNFTPAPGNDLDEETFRALLTRARDRLIELSGR